MNLHGWMGCPVRRYRRKKASATRLLRSRVPHSEAAGTDKEYGTWQSKEFGSL